MTGKCNELFEKFKKPGERDDPKYNRFFHLQRYLSFWVTIPFVYLPFSPNQITLLTNLLQLSSFFLIINLDGQYKLWGLLVYFIGGIFDFVDGNLARYRKCSSLKGVFYDQIGHVFIGPLFYLSASISAYYETYETLYLFVSIALAMFVPLMSYQISNIANYVQASERTPNNVPASSHHRRFAKKVISYYYHFKIELLALAIFFEALGVFSIISMCYFVLRFFLQLYIDQKNIDDKHPQWTMRENESTKIPKESCSEAKSQLVTAR